MGSLVLSGLTNQRNVFFFCISKKGNVVVVVVAQVKIFYIIMALSQDIS